MPQRSSLFSLNGRAGWLLFGGIWLVVGLPFLVIGISLALREVSLEERFAREGQTAQGMVLTKSIRPSSSRRRSSSDPQDWITYRFTTPSGDVVKGSAKVSEEEWDRLVERGPIQVTYLPGEPHRHRVEGQSSDWVGPVIFAMLGAIFSSLGGFIVLKGLGRG